MLTDGPFKKVFTKLLSPVFDITPASTVEGSMEMNLPILDEAAANDAAVCKSLLKQSTVLSYSSSSDPSMEAKAEKTHCERGEPVGNYTCVCKMNIAHFSMYAVGPFTTQESNNSNSGSSDGGLGAGAIVGIIFGVLAVIALILVGVVLMKKRQQASAPADPNVNL